jgi:hypothetical protein
MSNTTSRAFGSAPKKQAIGPGGGSNETPTVVETKAAEKSVPVKAITLALQALKKEPASDENIAAILAITEFIK